MIETGLDEQDEDIRVSIELDERPEVNVTSCGEIVCETDISGRTVGERMETEDKVDTEDTHDTEAPVKTQRGKIVCIFHNSFNSFIT